MHNIPHDTIVEALRRGDFSFFPQAICDRSGGIHYHELLIRMPIGDTVVMPATLIPIGIETFGREVFDRMIIAGAISAIAGGTGDFSINVNPSTFCQSDFSEFFDNLLESHDVAPERIILEILEESIDDVDTFNCQCEFMR